MAEVIVSHVWETGASTQVIIKAKVYPDSLETTEDIADQAVVTFITTVAALLETNTADEEDIDAEVEAGE
jgi:hypothetical protein